MPSVTEFPLHSFSDQRIQRISLEVDVEEAGLAELNGETVLRSPIFVEGEAFRQDEEVHLTLRVRVAAEARCRFCLDPVPLTVETSFRMLYQPIARRPDYLEDEEEVGLGYYEAGIIDIREDLRRYLLLEMPLWPVCREECLGLCHHCGTNLNHETCACAVKKGGGRRTQLAEKLDELFG